MADSTDTKKYLIDIQSNLDKYIKETVESKKRVEELNAQQKELKKSVGENSVAYQTNAAALRDAQKELSNNKKMVDTLTLANNAQKGSYEELYRTWQVAQTQLKLNGDMYTMNAKGVMELNQKYVESKNAVEQAKRGLDAFGKGVADNRLNVGNYSEAIEGAIGKFTAIPGPVGAAATAVKGFGASLKALLLNPVGLAIAAVAAAVTALISVFKNFQPIVEAIERAMSGLQAVFSTIKNIVIGLTTAQENLTESMVGLGNSMRIAYDEGVKWKRLQQELEDATNINAVADAKRKTQIDELLLASRNRTKSEAERMQLIEQALVIEGEQFNERKKLADGEVKLQQDKMTAGKRFTDEEKKMLDEYGVRYAVWIAQKKDVTDKEIKSLSDALVRQEQINNESVSLREKAQNRMDQLQDKEDAKKEKQISEEEKQRQEREKKQQAHLDRMAKIQDDNIKLMFLEAGKDDEKRKAALKAQYDFEVSQKGLSNTEKLILEKEYDNAIFAIEQERVKKSQENLQKEVDDYTKQQEEFKRQDQEMADWKANDDATKFEYQRMQNEGNLEALNQILDQEYNALLQSAEYESMTYNQRILAEEQYNKTKKELSQTRKDIHLLELNMIGGLLGTLGGLFGKQTIAAKALSIAQGTISSIAAGLKAMEELPVGSGPLLRFLTLASVIAAGLVQVKNIVAVKVPGGDSGSSPSLPTAISASAPAQRNFAQQTGSTMFTQPILTQTQLNAIPNQNPLTAEQIANAIAKLPAPRVTVEDINARNAEVKKVEVMATI